MCAIKISIALVVTVSLCISACGKQEKEAIDNMSTTDTAEVRTPLPADRDAQVIACPMLGPRELAAAIDSAESLGVLGRWSLAGIGRVACSEPYLDDRVECELPANTTLLWYDDTEQHGVRTATFSYVLLAQDGVSCRS